ncbi:hypothetical protein OFO93_39655, partial [Escherichia coli]|nr:hypothetical protein [Escherichia coli]
PLCVLLKPLPEEVKPYCFTSLRIAEAVAGRGKTVLFLVPSLALLSQTLDEWTQDTLIDLRCFAVCSDSDVGKKNHDDNVVV